MVQFNPETSQIGFDADEEHMVAFGFATEGLLLSPNRKVFDAARRQRNADNGYKGERDRMRDGDILWVDPSAPNFARDVTSALEAYVDSNQQRVLDPSVGFDTNALAYQEAELGCAKAQRAISQLAIANL